MSDSLRARLDRAQVAARTVERPPTCVCNEPFWAIYPPTCPAHPDRTIMEVTCS